MPQVLPSLGIDVGGGSAKIGIVSRDGEVLAQGAVASDPSASAPALLDRYLETAARLQASLGIRRFCGIGIGLPGHIDFARGTTRVGNVPALDDFPIAGYLRAKTDYPVHIENDATLAAMAEHRYGAGRGSSRFLAVALGTGIGAGFIENGRPVHTANGAMGDIGHVIVDPSGRRSCRQGCRGCLESVASALALEDDYRALRGGACTDGIDSLFAAARAGDAECRRIVAGAARSIGAAVVSWMHIFAPDRIAFAGGLSAAGEDLLSPIRETVSRLAMAGYAANLAILQATLGSKAGLVGAAALCFADKPHQQAP